MTNDRSYLKFTPTCRTCGKKMTLDDVDYNFKGNQDEYWVCEDCRSSVFAKIRYGKAVSVSYSDPEIDPHEKK